MVIYATKMKIITLSKEALCHNLEIKNKIIEQIMKYRYTGAEYTRSGSLQKKVTGHASKVTRMCVSLYDANNVTLSP
jgi:hypothetical protein